MTPETFNLVVANTIDIVESAVEKNKVTPNIAIARLTIVLRKFGAKYDYDMTEILGILNNARGGWSMGFYYALWYAIDEKIDRN